MAKSNGPACLVVTYVGGDVERFSVPHDGRWRMSHNHDEVPALVIVHHVESHVSSRRTIVPASSIRKIEVEPL